MTAAVLPMSADVVAEKDEYAAGHEQNARERDCSDQLNAHADLPVLEDSHHCSARFD